MDKKIPVIELFGPTIQGEGAMAGRVTNFLRLGGCPYRCKWCDTMYAVDPKQIKKYATYSTEDEIFTSICKLQNAPWITFSGGDPVMWDLSNLIHKLHCEGYKVSVETEGYLWKDWLRSVDQITLSPKPPSSGMDSKLHVSTLRKYTSNNTHTSLKVVIFNEDDYLWARRLHYLGFPKHPFYLSIGTSLGLNDEVTKKLIIQQLRWLFEKVCNDAVMHNVIVLPQLHVLAWGTKRGV